MVILEFLHCRDDGIHDCSSEDEDAFLSPLQVACHNRNNDLIGGVGH